MLMICQTSHSYHFFNPFVKVVRYTYPYNAPYAPYNGNLNPNYANQIPVTSYNPYISTYSEELIHPSHDKQSEYDVHRHTHPTINILVQKPYSIEKTFTVIPMLVIPQDNLNMISNGVVINVSKKKPLVTLKTNNRDTIQCTPAVKIVLDVPLTVYNVKTSIMFPSQMSIIQENKRIPIKVGALLIPVAQDMVVTEETPISVIVVYAIPTKPMLVDDDYVNNDKDVIIDNNSQSVIVESSEGQTTQAIADDEDSELGNFNLEFIFYSSF